MQRVNAEKFKKFLQKKKKKVKVAILFFPKNNSELLTHVLMKSGP